jgi:hypothetical protein
VRAQKVFEGGDGSVRHRTFPWSESSRRSPHPVLSQPCRVVWMQTCQDRRPAYLSRGPWLGSFLTLIMASRTRFLTGT